MQDSNEDGTCFSLLQHDNDEIHPDGEASFTFGEPILDFLGADVKENSISFNLPTKENFLVRGEKIVFFLDKLGLFGSSEESLETNEVTLPTDEQGFFNVNL